MKKLLFLSALVAGFISSCSEDNYADMASSEEMDRVIMFSTGKSASKTRSGETVSSLNEFYASAVNTDKSSFFDKEAYVYDSSIGAFRSQTPHYWPTTGTLSFYATNCLGEQSLDANNVPMYTYKNWDGEKDLVAATVIAGEKEIPYPLNFKHLTSQILVSAEAEDKSEVLTYKLVGVMLTAPSTGTYSFADKTGGVGSWSIDNSKTSEYSYASALPLSFKQNGEVELSSCYWNILPVTDGDLNFRVEYQVLQNGKVISDFTGDNYKVCTAKSAGLSAGKIYRYNFLLTRGTDDEITFTISMTDWLNGERTDVGQTTSFSIAGVEPFEVGSSATMQIIDESTSPTFAGTYTWYSDDEEVATIDRSTGVLTGVSEGKVTVIAKSSNGHEASVEVEILKATTGMENRHAWVDLGLPSGKKWAVENVGTSSSSTYGAYYCFGETTARQNPVAEEYKWYDHSGTYDELWLGTTKYQYADGHTNGIWYDDEGNFIGDGKTVLDIEDDAARYNWRGTWRTPSPEDFQELLDNCDVTFSGTSLCISSRVNNRYIILPSAGTKLSLQYWQYGVKKYNTSVNGVGEYGNYLTSGTYCDGEYSSVRYSNLFSFVIIDKKILFGSSSRTLGHVIRAVCD